MTKKSILAQAWEAREAAEGRELTPEEKWEAGVQLVAASGDPQAAEAS